MSSSDPRYIVQYHKLGCWVKGQESIPGNARGFGTATQLGKTLSVRSASKNPVSYTGVDDAPIGMVTAMVNFRLKAPVTTEGVLLSFGGFSNGGWVLMCDSAFMASGDGAGSAYPGAPQALEPEIDYTVFMTIDEARNVQFTYCRRNQYLHFHLVTGTDFFGSPMTNSSAPLSIGGSYNANQATPDWINVLNGEVGAFAVWDRKLHPTEIFQLLENPYQLWLTSDYGNYVITNVSTTFSAVPGATGSLGTVATSGKATTTVTGVSATTALGLIAAGNGVNQAVVGIQAQGVLGALPTAKAGAGVTLTGIAAPGELGVAVGSIGYQPLPMPTMRGAVGGIGIAGWNSISTPSDPGWSQIGGN